MKKIGLKILAATVFVLSAFAAQATPITYSFSVTGNGTLGGTAFTNQSMLFVLHGDTGITVQEGSFNSQFVTGLTAEFKLGSADFIDITETLRLHKTSSLLGFRADRGGADFFNFLSGATDFDFISDFGPLEDKNALRQSSPYLNTELGQLKLTSLGAGSASFVAALEQLPVAVSEPDPLLLLLAGLACMGWITRRKARTLQTAHA